MQNVIEMERPDANRWNAKLEGRVLERVRSYCEPYLPRMVLAGLDWGDITLALKGLRDADDDWFEGWASRGRLHEQAASDAAAQGLHVTRRDRLMKAVACYHFAQLPLFDEPETQFNARRRVRKLFREALPFLEHEARVLTVPFEDSQLPAYFLSAAGPEPSPCVILVNDLDSALEVELYACARELLARGISVFLFDGPGQGTLTGLHSMGVDYERVFGHVLSQVNRLRGIDPDRIGAFGLGFGGYLACRGAASFPNHVQACVSISGGFDHDNYPSLSPLARKSFLHAFNPGSDAAMSRLARERLNLREVPGLTVPLLAVHSREDAHVPFASCVRLMDWARGEKDLLVYPGERHVFTEHLGEFMPRVADWVAHRLAVPRS
jgi:dienelactone hydrolase